MLIRNLTSEVIRRLSHDVAFRKGQVTQESDVGKWIRLICSLTDVHTIVDVGTWSGAGTTQCAVRGVLEKSEKGSASAEVVGIELNPRFAKKAAKRFARHSFVTILCGTLVHVDDLDAEDLSGQEEMWLEQDRAFLASATLQMEKIPREIDCLILDGGEFSTLPEFLALRERVKGWIVLDDTLTRKNREVMKILLRDSGYALVYSSNERNGTAVFLNLAGQGQ